MLAQQRQQAVGQLQGGGHVEVDKLGERFFVMLFEQAEMVDAGGVDQGIQRAETFRSGHHCFTAVALADIGLEHVDLARIALRRELADTRVKVLYFAPRATRTGMNAANVVAMNDELHQAMDEPQAVAQQLLQAIRREDDERYLGWPEKFFVRLNSLLPRVVDQALRKQLPIIQRFARSKP